MSEMTAKMKEEGIRRMELLSKKYNLGPKLTSYLRQGKIYCSYGYSMDTISYDPTYEEAVKRIESLYHIHVYHAIEAETALGTMLSLLYVSSRPGEWEMEVPDGNYILSFTFLTGGDCTDGEFGDIGLGAPLGYLMRTA